jgi:hypothetical protein
MLFEHAKIDISFIKLWHVQKVFPLSMPVRVEIAQQFMPPVQGIARKYKT